MSQHVFTIDPVSTSRLAEALTAEAGCTVLRALSPSEKISLRSGRAAVATS